METETANELAIRELAYRLIEEEMSSRRLVEGTRKVVRMTLRVFFRWASRRGTKDIRALRKKDLASFHAWLSRQPSKATGEPLSANTVNYRFYIVGTLYSCLYRAGAIGENPARSLYLSMPTYSKWMRRPLTRTEIATFLESIDVSTRQGLRDRATYELMYSSGLRVSEVAGLRVGDIDFARRLMIVRGKFDRDRMVPISEVARDFLVRHVGDRIDRADAWVFERVRAQQTKNDHRFSVSISVRFRKLLRSFGMDAPEISAHSIRHSTATHLLENGASVRHVQELLGHRNIESTVRYTQVMTDNLAKVHRRHHPREHELYEAVDDDYDRRLAALVQFCERPLVMCKRPRGRPKGSRNKAGKADAGHVDSSAT